MLGITIHFKKNENLLLHVALSSFIEEIRTSEKAPYEMTKKKLTDPEATIDGMFMRCMENALDSYCSKHNNQKTIQECTRLALFIKGNREEFQMNAMSRLFQVS